ncbi:hypothetical protein ACLOAV_009086 [Pseudogymnoascus australis]
MPVFNRYQYKPLCAEDEARFIALDPAKDNEDSLSCSIVQCRRSTNNLEYCAISYAWGDNPKFSENLEIKYDGDTSYLRITPYVNGLLRRLRASHVQNHLWIDAICINQADEEEQSSQIPVIGRIFEEAKVVRIWLGLNDSMIGKVFAFIRKASRLSEVEKVEMSSQMAKLIVNVFGNSYQGLQCLDDFSNIPWFSRRWIIQEACLAQHAIIHCGSYSIPLPLLVLAATRFQTLDMSSYPIKVMANLRRPTTKLTVLEVLWNFHEARCFLPKDNIAALYGLISEEYRVHLDYTAHWAELYKQVVTGIFRVGNNDTRLQVLFHLLEFGPITHLEDIDCPSWVPDWSKSRRRVLPYYSETRNPDTYEAHPTFPGHSANASVTFQHDALRIHWPALSSRLQARQVIYATKFDSALDNGRNSAENVWDTLNELFPCPSGSTLQLFALSYLIEKIVKFRHSNEDQRSSCSLLDAYIGNINSQERPKSSKGGMFDSLRKLGSLLQEFCIFKLESIGASEAYGIGTQQIQVGDVMIPLWNPEFGSDWCNGFLNQNEKGIYMSTMLAARCIEEQPSQRIICALSNRKWGKTGRIIGSALCVLIEPTRGHDRGLSIDTDLDGYKNREQQRSMRLI